MRNIVNTRIFYPAYQIYQTGFRFLSTTSNYSSKFADPKYDIAFKMLFGTEANKPLLISLLNSLLGFKDVKVSDVELLPSMILPEYDRNLSAELDVRCKLSNSKEILVEMQRLNEEYFLPRTQYYMAKALSTQLTDGGGKLHHKLLLPVHIKHQWLDFINSCALHQEIPKGALPEIEMAYSIMEKHNWSRDQLSQYDSVVKKSEEDNVDRYSLFEADLLQAEEKGKNKGIEEGKAKGKADSVAKIIMKLQQSGMDIETISKVTGITIEQLDDIFSDQSRSIADIANLLFSDNQNTQNLHGDSAVSFAGQSSNTDDT